jgi:hypothetical protein
VSPLLRAGLLAALLAALAVVIGRSTHIVRVGVGAAPSASASGPAPSALCPRGTLPDGDVCVPVPTVAPSASAH